MILTNQWRLTLAMLALATRPALAAGEPAPADTTVLTLPACIELALKNNFGLQAERYTPKIAARQVQAASGAFDPQLSSEYTFTSQHSPGSSDPVNPEKASVVENADHVFGVKGQVPWGLKYQISLEATSQAGTYNDFFRQYESFAGISIVQPLLRGFIHNSDRRNLRVAKKSRTISTWDFRQTVTNVVFDTISAYTDYSFATKNVEITRGSRDRAKRLLDDNRERVARGVMAEADLVLAEADVASRAEKVLGAERLALDQFNRLTALISGNERPDLGRNFAVEPLPPPARVDIDAKRDFLPALQKRPDYRRAQLGLEIAEIDLSVAKNELLPTVNVVGSYGVYGRGDTLGSSIDRLSAEDPRATTVGVVFALPFPSRQTRGQKAVAQLARNRQEVNIARLRQSILLSLDSAAGRVQTNWERIRVAERGRTLSERSLSAEEKKLESETTTVFVLLRVQQDLANSQALQYLTIADYYKSLAEYERQAGTILDRYSITTED